MARRKQSSAKPAPRKRGATSTRKPRAASRRAGPRIPGWLWLLVGLVAGFLASQHQHGSAPWQDGSRTVAVIPATPSDGTADSAQDSKESGPTTPTFEFYTLLPETEVIAPGNEMPTSTATPPQPADGDTPADTRPGVSDSDPIAQIIAANTTTKSTSRADVTPTTTRTETSRQRTLESSGQRYMLQAASFRERGDASELSQRLGNFGLQTKISEVHTDDGATWHRVQSGPYSDRREVDRARDLMATRGITPLLIQLQN